MPKPRPKVLPFPPTAGKLQLAQLFDFTAEGPRILLQYGDNPIQAQSIVDLSARNTGRTVTVDFTTDGEAVITGLVRTPEEIAAAREGQLAVSVDGRTLKLSAHERIELRCGDASLVLTKDGKAVLKGVEVVSRASASNRIKGGSVQIN